MEMDTAGTDTDTDSAARDVPSAVAALLEASGAAAAASAAAAALPPGAARYAKALGAAHTAATLLGDALDDAAEELAGARAEASAPEVHVREYVHCSLELGRWHNQPAFNGQYAAPPPPLFNLLEAPGFPPDLKAIVLKARSPPPAKAPDAARPALKRGRGGSDDGEAAPEPAAKKKRPAAAVSLDLGGSSSDDSDSEADL